MSTDGAKIALIRLAGMGGTMAWCMEQLEFFRDDTPERRMIWAEDVGRAMHCIAIAEDALEDARDLLDSNTPTRGIAPLPDKVPA